MPTFEAEFTNIIPETLRTAHPEAAQLIINRATELHEAYKAQAVKEVEQAFGGCKKCYGKGYATWRHGETHRGVTTNLRNDIKYCDCDRGKQLANITENK